MVAGSEDGAELMSDNRLRRLDALFAERVLGCKVVYITAALTDSEKDACCGCGGALHGNGLLMNLPPYTRDLTEAWGSAITSDYCPDLFNFCDTCAGEENRERVQAIVHRKNDEDDLCWVGSASHPAEALVLACLRAVGVGEEEINATAVEG